MSDGELHLISRKIACRGGNRNHNAPSLRLLVIQTTITTCLQTSVQTDGPQSQEGTQDKGFDWGTTLKRTKSKSVRLNASVSCHFCGKNSGKKLPRSIKKSAYKNDREPSGICRGNNSWSKCNKKIRAVTVAVAMEMEMQSRIDVMKAELQPRDVSMCAEEL